MIRHPGERQLLAYDDGELSDLARRRVARHLTDCQRCRNMVQGHRATRAVLRLEAPPAPGGVLERILASRAAGTAIVLPVAEPDAGHAPAGTRTGLVAILTTAVAALVVLVVQVVPHTPLANGWQRWSQAVAEWEPFGAREFRIPEFTKPPIAAPAVLEAARARAFTATYRMIYSDPRDGVREWPMAVRLRPASDSGDWLIQASWRGGDWFLRSRLVSLPGTDSTGASRALGLVDSDMGESPDAVVALMTLVPLERGWHGSFQECCAIDTILDEVIRGHDRTVSYYIEGSDRLTTALGTVDAWRVKSTWEYGYEGPTQWYRKSDGLLLRSTRRIPGETAGYTQELVSVTYP